MEGPHPSVCISACKSGSNNPSHGDSLVFRVENNKAMYRILDCMKQENSVSCKYLGYNIILRPLNIRIVKEARPLTYLNQILNHKPKGGNCQIGSFVATATLFEFQGLMGQNQRRLQKRKC